MSDAVLEGGCQCGSVRYRITGDPVMTALCHCTMCRRANAAPAVGRVRRSSAALCGVSADRVVVGFMSKSQE